MLSSEDGGQALLISAIFLITVAAARMLSHVHEQRDVIQELGEWSKKLNITPLVDGSMLVSEPSDKDRLLFSQYQEVRALDRSISERIYEISAGLIVLTMGILLSSFDPRDLLAMVAVGAIMALGLLMIMEGYDNLRDNYDELERLGFMRHVRRRPWWSRKAPPKGK